MNMHRRSSITALLAFALGACSSTPPLPEGQGSMSFFVTSRNMGNGGDLDGLAGADAHCLTLAQAAGSPIREWRAYLSASTDSGPVHARDRIGVGPWFNVKGVRIAANVGELHGDDNALGPSTSLTETGVSIGRPHDILTGSNPDGTWAGTNATCANWTSRSSNDTAMLGHYDKRGGGTRPRSWNSAHISQGCSPPALEATAGDARFYCFATSTENGR